MRVPTQKPRLAAHVLSGSDRVLKDIFPKTSNFASNCVTSGQPTVKVQSPPEGRTRTLLLDITSDQGTMAREEWETVTRDNGGMEATSDNKTSGGKTVRFVAGSSENTQCDNRQVKTRDSGPRNPQLNMVQSLVPHLPGLEKDKVYVISGTELLLVMDAVHFFIEADFETFEILRYWNFVFSQKVQMLIH